MNRPARLAAFFCVIAAPGCATLPVEVKSSASVEAEQARWGAADGPKVVARVAVECTRKGAPR